MKRIILNFVITLIISCGLAVNAQNPEKNLKDSPLVGLWIFEKTLVDNTGKKIVVYPGSFMMIKPDGNFSFFLYTQRGGFIINEGTITLKSDSVYTEKINFNTDPSYIGMELNQKYIIKNNTLVKTRIMETNNSKQETEIWRRVERPNF